MSNTSTFAVGLGSGLALWHLTKPKPAAAPGASTSSATAPTMLTARTRRNGVVRLEPTCLTVDGAHVDVAEAVRRCDAAGLAAVTVAPHAPASTYAALMAALRAANVPTHLAQEAGTRNAASAATAETSSMFTLAVYPQGLKGPKRVSWFHAASPSTWENARDRLTAAGLIDKRVRAPGEAGYWKLATDPRIFNAERAKPLPGESTLRRGASRTTERYTREGRTILRDGEAILYVDRVDLGDARYAISPHQADLLTERMVRLLNRHGAR